jgi:hypothetical protein
MAIDGNSEPLNGQRPKVRGPRATLHDILELRKTEYWGFQLTGARDLKIE